MTAATANHWAEWLRPVAAAVRNPPSPQDFQGRCAALAFSLSVPASALTASKARDLCRKSEFWPSVAEVEALFAEDWREQARSRSIGGSGMARLAPPAPVEIDPAARAASAERARAIAAELRATPAIPKLPVKPLPLHPHHLLAAYEAEAERGNEAAAMRAEQLRKAMGIEA